MERWSKRIMPKGNLKRIANPWRLRGTIGVGRLKYDQCGRMLVPAELKPRQCVLDYYDHVNASQFTRFDARTPVSQHLLDSSTARHLFCVSRPGRVQHDEACPASTYPSATAWPIHDSTAHAGPSRHPVAHSTGPRAAWGRSILGTLVARVPPGPRARRAYPISLCRPFH